MAEKKKVMDVAKPEDVTPPIGTKPMIVGHKSLPIDPMVKPEEDKNSEETITESPISEKLVAPSEKQKVITPPSETKKVDTTVDPEEIRTDEPKDATPTVTSDDTSQTSTPETKPKEISESSKDSNEVASETPDEQSGEKDEKEIDPVAAEMEKEDEIRKMIDSKKYFVSVKQAKRSSPARAILALIAVLLIGLGMLFYLVDTDKLDVGFELPFSLFSQNENQLSTPIPTTNIDGAENDTQVTKDDVVDEMFSNEKFDFTMKKNSDWRYEDESTYVDGQPFILSFSILADKYAVKASTVTGKGGMCEPAEDDKPHEEGNTCPTEENYTITKVESGWLRLVKYTDTGSETSPAKTTYSYCYTPTKSMSGAEVSEPKLNDPQMGFVLQCGPDDIFINIYKVGDANQENAIYSAKEDPAYYDDPEIKTILENLATIRLYQNR